MMLVNKYAWLDVCLCLCVLPQHTADVSEQFSVLLVVVAIVVVVAAAAASLFFFSFHYY